ncbi:FCS-Like Zinc finger 6-like [Gastrolobium bilobum]|uniref:FCS-Like Zinc finger 6-like n=1 Tax=Gastrolobium bilobum TaxID=150636 RepID=UPI002AAF8AD4|nr:FCS-Like Zinc finger 6-like [Gastrolobium bilobum]
MLLGKRPRPPVMRRTTSMSGGMAVDMQGINNLEAEEEDGIKDPPHHAVAMGPHHGLVPDQTKTSNNQNQTSNCNNTSHVVHTAHFLRTCGLCKCRLAPSRDIYMYRGDTAFCSSECREQQMKQDQRKEKGKVLSSNKEDHRASPPTVAATATATVKASAKSETAAACT